MELILVGIDMSAGAGLFERLSSLVDPVSDTLRDLSEMTDEALILSTCNRVEIYAVVAHAKTGTAALDDYLKARAGAAVGDPHSGIYRMRGQEAAAHLFMVAAGLRSMVRGDAQITGQLRVALKQAVLAGTAGQILRLAFEHALKASRRIRARSQDGGHADSIAAAAVDLISDAFGPMSELKAVVVGAGKTGAFAAHILAARGVRQITVVNRSIERARSVARGVGGIAFGLPELGTALCDADAVISATGAHAHVITAADLRDADLGDRSRPLIVIDMAVPNDVEPSAAALSGVDLYDIYRIGDLLRQQSREGAFACEGDAYAAIQQQVIHFETGTRAARRGALIQSVVARSDSVRVAEMERASRALQRLGHDPESLLPVLDAMTNSIARKLLHAPITYIRRADSDESAAAVLHMFGHELPVGHGASEINGHNTLDETTSAV